MVKFGLLVFFASIVAVSQGDNIGPEPIPPQNGSTTSTTSTSSTSSTSTTSVPTTTATSSTASPTNTSTTMPTTVSPTTPVVTTTAVPPTVRPATVEKWRVKDGNVTCIMADLAIQVDVVLDANKTDHYIVDVPSNASIDKSFCNITTQALVLTWNSEVNNTLTLQFGRNGTKFMLTQVVLNMTKDSTEFIFKHDEPEFPTPVNKSYHCAKDQEIKLIDSGNKTVGVLKINSVQWEAFNNKTVDSFSAAEDCASSTSPDIVPIAVGCALVGLVAIVLIAYLVGRRRSQARGYLSM